MAPTISASMPASATASAGSSVTSSGVIATAIMGATDASGPSTRIREGPSSAYPTRTAIVVYSPLTGGSPASSAYAIPCGTRIAASTTPAMMSKRSHELL